MSIIDCQKEFKNAIVIELSELNLKKIIGDQKVGTNYLNECTIQCSFDIIIS